MKIKKVKKNSFFSGLLIAMTNVAGRIVILATLCCALASCIDAKVRPRPVFGGDPYRGKNIARDVLLPGEQIANVLSFGAVPDGKTDSTQVTSQLWVIYSFWLLLVIFFN